MLSNNLILPFLFEFVIEIYKALYYLISDNKTKGQFTSHNGRISSLVAHLEVIDPGSILKSVIYFVIHILPLSRDGVE